MKNTNHILPKNTPPQWVFRYLSEDSNPHLSPISSLLLSSYSLGGRGFLFLLVVAALSLSACTKEKNSQENSQNNDSSQFPGYNEEHWTWNKNNITGLLFDTNSNGDTTINI